MKQYIILGASLLSLLAAGCSNEDIIENENPDVVAGKTITLNASINNGPDTRMTYEYSVEEGLKFTWSTSEAFNLYQGTSSTAAEFKKNAAGNTFTGIIPAGGTGSYYAVYGNNITNTDGVLTADISSQKGTNAENGITHFMVAETKDLTQTLSFSHKLAVLKLNLEFPKGVSGKIDKVTVMGFHNKATYTLADDKYAYVAADMGDITATNGETGFTIGDDNKITAYIAVFPEYVFECNAMIKVEVGDDTYLYTLQNTNTLEAGKVIPVNVTMIKLEYVDLGLSVKWANMNVGANRPEQYGGRYAWGEMVNKEKCTLGTYMCTSWNDFGGDNDPLKDYVNNKKSIAGTDYDVAHVKWGGKWKMPTLAQIEELYSTNNCSRKWTENYNDTKIAGWILTSLKSGYTSNSIFLPAAGYRYDLPYYVGSNGYYKSATPFGRSAPDDAYILGFESSKSFSPYSNGRYMGHSVRPVSE